MGNTLGISELGEDYLDLVDETVKGLLGNSADRTKIRLNAHKGLVQALATTLVEKETMTFEEIKAFIEGFYANRPELVASFVGLRL